MEYLEGNKLKHVISRRPMELERVLTVAIDVALPNEEDNGHDHASDNSSQCHLSGSHPWDARGL
jgi:hypothetical protein